MNPMKREWKSHFVAQSNTQEISVFAKMDQTSQAMSAKASLNNVNIFPKPSNYIFTLKDGQRST